MKKYTKGFTLIELLVVIAIIGILASVVLVSLNSARNKGKDARVISNVQQMRTALETNYDGSQYTALTGTASTVNTAGTFSSSNPYAQLTSDTTGQGSTLSARIGTNAAGNATSYVIYAALVTDNTKYFCIDSTGKTNPAGSAPATTGAVACPN